MRIANMLAWLTVLAVLAVSVLVGWEALLSHNGPERVIWRGQWQWLFMVAVGVGVVTAALAALIALVIKVVLPLNAKLEQPVAFRKNG